jgi:hypothetical protein
MKDFKAIPLDILRFIRSQSDGLPTLTELFLDLSDWHH